jgi:hypothetical protein
MQKEAVTNAKQRPGFQKDLRHRTKAFALRMVGMFSALPKTKEAQVLGNHVFLAAAEANSSSYCDRTES